MLAFNSGLLVISCIFAFISLPSGAFGDLENLSTAQLEDLLKTLEYEEEYRNEVEPPAGAYSSSNVDPDYYNPYDPVEPEQQQELSSLAARQSESLQHGTPFLSLPHLSAGGPTKANPGSQQQQLSGSPLGQKGVPVLPAYCDPPNPCPIGYTEKDGCIEDFENSSEFSRKYQARQNCLCDSEHMFNCPMEEQKDEAFLAGFPPSLGSELEGRNPFLAGNKLPIAAKKGLGF